MNSQATKRFKNANWQMEETPIEKERKITNSLINAVEKKGFTWKRVGNVFNISNGTTKKARVMVNAANVDVETEKQATKAGVKFFNALSEAELTAWLNQNLK